MGMKGISPVIAAVLLIASDNSCGWGNDIFMDNPLGKLKNAASE